MSDATTNTLPDFRKNRPSQNMRTQSKEQLCPDDKRAEFRQIYAALVGTYKLISIGGFDRVLLN